MIDFYRELNQKVTFTGEDSELLVSYIVKNEDEFVEFDNVVFGYAEKGEKSILFSNSRVIYLKQGIVAMGSERIAANTKVRNVSTSNPLVCFRLDVSKEKVWGIIDKINSNYSIPELIEEEQKLIPTEIYSGQACALVFDALRNIQNLYPRDVKYKDYWLNLKIEELILACLQTDMRNSLIHNYTNDQIQDHPLAYVIKHIKNNIYDDINIKTLADKAYMSRATFFRQFKHLFGMTPNNYIQFEKIKEAQRVLKNTNKPVSEIAHQLGYSSVSYFRLCFKRYTGYSPKDYLAKRDAKMLLVHPDIEPDKTLT